MPYKDPEKQRAAQRKHYESNKAAYIERGHRQRDKRRQWIRDYKERHGCMDCKIKYPYYVLQLDHRDGRVGSDDKAISKLVHWVGLERIKEEVKKCDVVCANCHAIRTWCRVVNTEEGIPDYERGI